MRNGNKKAIIKIAIAATASDGAILEKTDVSALSRALIHFDLFRDMTVEKIRRLADETLAEIKSAASQGRIVEEVAKLIEKAIAKAGEHLKLKVPLAGEGKCGKNWKEVH